MHPISQILNYDEPHVSQSKVPEHLHLPVHVKDDPKIYESLDSEAIEFFDRYITCAAQYIRLHVVSLCRRS